MYDQRTTVTSQQGFVCARVSYYFFLDNFVILLHKFGWRSQSVRCDCVTDVVATCVRMCLFIYWEVCNSAWDRMYWEACVPPIKRVRCMLSGADERRQACVRYDSVSVADNVHTLKGAITIERMETRVILMYDLASRSPNNKRSETPTPTMYDVR